MARRKSTKYWLTMTLPCEELAVSLETSKLIGIDQEQGKRGMPAPDCLSTEGNGKWDLFYSSYSLLISFGSSDEKEKE